MALSLLNAMLAIPKLLASDSVIRTNVCYIVFLRLSGHEFHSISVEKAAKNPTIMYTIMSPCLN